MTSFSPKSNFQKFNTFSAEELQKHREDSWLTVGFAYSLAEMANRGADAAMMSGARNFIHIFQNLWESEGRESKLPVQRLESYERPLEELLKEKTIEREA